METFGILGFSLGSMGFIFGIISFTKIQELENKLKKMQDKIDDLKND